MRIAVVGVGGVGGYFGGRLAEAGHEVVFFARGALLAALRERGLRIESPAGDASLQPVATGELDKPGAGVFDLVLLGVKAWQVRDVAPQLQALLAPEGVVVPLQNGVEAAEELRAALGPARVLGGLCRIVAYAAEPGVIRHVGVAPSIEIGELEGPSGERVARIAKLFEAAAGARLVVVDDIRAASWEKFLFISSVSAVGAVTRQPVGAYRAVPESRRLLEDAMQEVAAIARARGVALDASAVERTLAYVDSLPGEATASMQRDMAAGRPSELESQVGAVVRLGREAGVPTPANAFLFAALLPAELRARAAAL
jgi:2-dehydropantoate 2-reductase